MRILAMADLHGGRRAYARMIEIARGGGVDAVVLAGDLLGAPPGFATVEDAQLVDSREVAALLEGSEVPVLFIMGNDDLVEIAPRSHRLRSIHGVRVELSGFNFVGYQYSLPFMGGVFEKPEDGIAADVAALEPLMDDRTVLVTHNPAYGFLDLAVLDVHAGSPSIRDAVARRAVRAHIHGHVHGRFGRDGCHFNVACGSKNLRGMVLDLESLEHEVFGEGPAVVPPVTL